VEKTLCRRDSQAICIRYKRTLPASIRSWSLSGRCSSSQKAHQIWRNERGGANCSWTEITKTASSCVDWWIVKAKLL